MADDFKFDVFLSHSAKDKGIVRPLAERLRSDGLRVWFDEWEIKPGDSIPAKIEEGLEHSRVLLLCMSANAFGSDWAQLEAGTFRFRDPLNRERRFIPLRLDDAPIRGSLAQFLYINWGPADRTHEYAKLLEACRHSASWPLPESRPQTEQRLVARSKDSSEISEELTPAERAILSAVPDHGWIYLARCDAYGRFVDAGEGKFFDPEDASVQAKYLDAFESLLAKGLIRAEGGDAFRPTGRGYELRKHLTMRGQPPTWSELSTAEKVAAPRAVQPLALAPQPPTPRPTGEMWGGIRGVLEQEYSTKIIKGILGRAGLPILKIKYDGTLKGPLLDETDKLVAGLDDASRNQFVIGCVQEIVGFEQSKAKNLSKFGRESDGLALRSLQQVLGRFGHSIKELE